jgi:putative transposase
MTPESNTDDTRQNNACEWPHAPPHRLSRAGVYFVTARCLDQRHHFSTPERRDFLHEKLHELAAHYGWRLEAWAVLSNHHHFVAHSPADSLEERASAASLQKFLRHLHGDTARHVNKLDHAAGRQVWYNFRETLITYENSYYARLNYTHQNPVHHGLVPLAADWKWCSAAAFEQTVTPAMRKTIYGFKYDEIAAEDGE